MKKFSGKIKWKTLIIWLVIIAVLITAGIVGYKKIVDFRKSKTVSSDKVETAKVETRDIETTLESSGSIAPLNTYEVKTLVSGEVISADFEEGDTVKKGQILYKIATDDLDNKIDSSETLVSRAEKSYTKAKESYADAVKDYEETKSDYAKAVIKYGNPNIVASEDGVIKTLYIKKDSEIQKGNQIAQIYNNSDMLLKIPFSADKVNASFVGKTAKITFENSDEVLTGKVTIVSGIKDVLSGNRLVKQVTIKVTNPGGITNETTATATIGALDSSATGTFSVLTDTTLTSDKAGEIAYLKVSEGSKVKKGDTIAVLSQDSIDSLLDNYSKAVETAKKSIENAEDSVEKAKESIEDAKDSLDETIDSRTDYSIKAPISGKIITKNTLKGDTISANNSNSTALCVIYDLSAVTFEMQVDELDVSNVKEGQEVVVTADALENTTMSGKVVNVSLVSTSSQGVTQYPVTVRMDEVGNLLPGMNVTGKIILDKVEGVIAIPSDALMRGDRVYVKDDTANANITKNNTTKNSATKNNTGINNSVKDTTVENNAKADGTSKKGFSNVPDGFKAVKVETGITDGDYIEIKSGLTGNEEVYVVRTSTATTQNMPQFMNMQGGGQNRRQGSSQGGSFQGGMPGR